MAFWTQATRFGVICEKCMSFTLYSLSVYEEIVAHATLNMMTKLTDHAVADASDFFGTKERSEAFRKAWIGAAEATLLERKESKLLLPTLD